MQLLKMLDHEGAYIFCMTYLFLFSQTNLYLYDDMLGIEPLELRFPLEHNKQTSCSVELTNETNNSIAFNIQTPSKQYSTRPDKGIVLPGCKRDVKITLYPQESATQVTNYDKFVVQSTQVNDGLADEDIADHMFKSKGGKKMVDEVNLMVLYELDREEEAVSKVSYVYWSFTETSKTGHTLAIIV